MAVQLQLLTTTGSQKLGRTVVDTVEKLQGDEAGFVICLFSHTHLPSAETDLPFLLERRRLNVAISRSQTLCIVITSQAVLQPVRVLLCHSTEANDLITAAYNLLGPRNVSRFRLLASLQRPIVANCYRCQNVISASSSVYLYSARTACYCKKSVIKECCCRV